MADITTFPIPTEVLDPANYPEFIGPKGDQGDPGPKGDQGDPGDITSSGSATDGQVLTADGAGGLAWEDPAGGLAGSTGSTDNAILRANGTEGGTVQAGTNAPSYNDDGEVSIAPVGLTGSEATSALEISQTWNTTGNPTAVKVNVTNTASGVSANLLDLQVGGASKASITKDGGLSCISLACPSIIVNGAALIFGVSGGPTFQIYLGNFYGMSSTSGFYCGTVGGYGWEDAPRFRDAAGVVAQRNSTNPQESRLYGSYTSATNYHRLSTKTIREAVTAASGASVTTTISIPKFSHLIGVTTRVTTALGETNGTTGYQVGDGSDPDKWGAITGVAIGTTSDAANFTAIDALGPSATDRTITLTAVGGNFDGTGVIEVCAFYLRAEAD